MFLHKISDATNAHIKTCWNVECSVKQADKDELVKGISALSYLNYILQVSNCSR